MTAGFTIAAHSPTLASGTMLPPGLVIPTSIALVALLAGHVLGVARSNEPGSRKRIRMSNGVVMILAVALMGTGVSVLDPDRHTGQWVLCWLAVFALIWFCIVLAGVDAANTYRLTLLRRRELRANLRRTLQESREPVITSPVQS